MCYNELEGFCPYFILYYYLLEVDELAKEITDNDIKKKAVKLVVAHIKKKLPEGVEINEDIHIWLGRVPTIPLVSSMPSI